MRCDPQADVAKVRPIQGKRMQQHQLSGLQPLVEKGLAEVPVLLVSWYVNFAVINTPAKHHGVHTPAGRNTSELWNRGTKVW